MAADIGRILPDDSPLVSSAGQVLPDMTVSALSKEVKNVRKVGKDSKLARAAPQIEVFRSTAISVVRIRLEPGGATDDGAVVHRCGSQGIF